MENVLDKNGNALSTGDTVTVDQTEDNVEFTGHVDSIKYGIVTVLDQEDNAFDVEANQVELENPPIKKPKLYYTVEKETQDFDGIEECTGRKTLRQC